MLGFDERESEKKSGDPWYLRCVYSDVWVWISNNDMLVYATSRCFKAVFDYCMSRYYRIYRVECEDSCVYTALWVTVRVFRLTLVPPISMRKLKIIMQSRSNSICQLNLLSPAINVGSTPRYTRRGYKSVYATFSLSHAKSGSADQKRRNISEFREVITRRLGSKRHLQFRISFGSTAFE